MTSVDLTKLNSSFNSENILSHGFFFRVGILVIPISIGAVEGVEHNITRFSEYFVANNFTFFI